LNEFYDRKLAQFEQNWTKFTDIMNSSIKNKVNKENIESLISKSDVCLNAKIFTKDCSPAQTEKVIETIYANCDQDATIRNVNIANLV
jgi:hypothetical protein